MSTKEATFARVHKHVFKIKQVSKIGCEQIAHLNKTGWYVGNKIRVDF